MSRAKRFQILVDPGEDQLFQRAADLAGVPASTWARNVLKATAEKALGPGRVSPKEAVRNLARLNSPVADVETLIRESTEGRYGDLP